MIKKIIEFEDVKSFIEYYRENKKDGTLTNDIEICKNEIFTVYSKEEYIQFTKLYREKAMHQMTTELLTAIMEFPDDVFHIMVKSNVVEFDYHVGWEFGVKIKMYLKIYVFSTQKFKMIHTGTALTG